LNDGKAPRTLLEALNIVEKGKNNFSVQMSLVKKERCVPSFKGGLFWLTFVSPRMNTRWEKKN